MTQHRQTLMFKACYTFFKWEKFHTKSDLAEQQFILSNCFLLYLKMYTHIQLCEQQTSNFSLYKDTWCWKISWVIASEYWYFQKAAFGHFSWWTGWFQRAENKVKFPKDNFWIQKVNLKYQEVPFLLFIFIFGISFWHWGCPPGKNRAGVHWYSKASQDSDLPCAS